MTRVVEAKSFGADVEMRRSSARRAPPDLGLLCAGPSG